VIQRAQNFMQLCWVVPDLEASIQHWVSSCGAGPFFVFESLHFDDGNYRGQPSDIEPCRAAIGQFGNMQIELVTPTGIGTGVWSDVVPNGGHGLHHAGLYCTDYAAERAAYTTHGETVAFEGLMMGAKTCYIDTVKTLGFMVELITANPTAAYVFEQFRKAAENWDGRDPIRALG
jgi:hypothetical protein